MQHQLAERAQQEHEDAADLADQEQTRALPMQGKAAGAEKGRFDGTTEKRSFAVAGYGGLCEPVFAREPPGSVIPMVALSSLMGVFGRVRWGTPNDWLWLSVMRNAEAAT